MTVYAGIEDPVSAESPCGPDPDADPEIQNFLAFAEGQLPASYRDFDRKKFEAKQSLTTLKAYLGKSRDLRFLVLAAKFHVLSDDLKGFVDAIAATRALLLARWDECHPTEAAGGAPLRSAYLASFNDLPTVVLPLQSATLVNDKRLGPLSMRSILLADRKIPARDKETVFDAPSIKDALLRFEPVERLVEVKNSLDGVLADLGTMHQVFVDRAGHHAAPEFDRLSDLVSPIRSYFAEIVATRQPDAAPAEPAEDAAEEVRQPGFEPAPQRPAPVQDVASVKEVSNALAAILAYYASCEPSSPARLLVKQAHLLVGKSFIEIMKILAPGMAEKAKINIGGTTPFSLNFAQLAALAVDEGKPAEGEAEPRLYAAATRLEATALMRSVEAFYRTTEPSSPIPMLVEKARTLVAKDFNDLLAELSKKDEK